MASAQEMLKKKTFNPKTRRAWDYLGNKTQSLDNTLGNKTQSLEDRKSVV